MATTSTPTVCVTGATGFLASHVIHAALQAGFCAVHGTVRSLGNKVLLRPLLEGACSDFAPERLQLFEADLLQPGAAGAGFAKALEGCDCLIHTATPVIVPNSSALGDTALEAAFVKPAVDGTLQLLELALAAGVRAVVLTASTACMLGRPEFDEPSVPSVIGANKVSDLEVSARTCFGQRRSLFMFSRGVRTRVDQWMRRHKQWYRLAKTQQESATRAFCSRHGISLITLHPSLIMGVSGLLGILIYQYPLLSERRALRVDGYVAVLG
jgi:nucleoside-diphosphate-sugar epimerase